MGSASPVTKWPYWGSSPRHWLVPLVCTLILGFMQRCQLSALSVETYTPPASAPLSSQQRVEAYRMVTLPSDPPAKLVRGLPGGSPWVFCAKVFPPSSERKTPAGVPTKTTRRPGGPARSTANRSTRPRTPSARRQVPPSSSVKTTCPSAVPTNSRSGWARSMNIRLMSPAPGCLSSGSGRQVSPLSRVTYSVAAWKPLRA